MASNTTRSARPAGKYAAALIALLALALAGCAALLGEPEDPNATPTPNPTLEAIAVMLTETRAAPSTTPVTPTVTPSITPTLTITPTRQVIGRVGEAVEANGLTLALLSAARQPAIAGSKAGQGQEYLSVEVLLANRSDRALDYYPLYFRLNLAERAGEDEEYEPARTAEWPALQGGTLRPGERVRGHLAFLIPTEGGRARLRFTLPDLTLAPPLWVDLAQPTAAAPLTLVPATGGLPAGLPGAGQRVEESGVALTIQQVKAGQRMEGIRAAKGRKLAILSVTIQNAAREQTPYNPFYFKARDEAGYEYIPVLVGIESLLHPGSLSRGQQVSGQVVLEVPEETGRLLILYQPQVLVEEYGEIRVEVEIP